MAKAPRSPPPLCRRTPRRAGGTAAIKNGKLRVRDLLPPLMNSFYRYEGSLTTPPCSEGVTWIVMSTPMHVSKKTIAKFHKILGNNNRPVHPLNGRHITYTH